MDAYRLWVGQRGVWSSFWLTVRDSRHWEGPRLLNVSLAGGFRAPVVDVYPFKDRLRDTARVLPFMVKY